MNVLVAHDQDEALIGLCDGLVRNQAAERELIASDNGMAAPRLRALATDFRRIVGALDGMRPTTMRGAVAMARAAMARIPCDADGDPSVDDGADQLLVKIAAFLSTAEVAA